MVVEGSSDMKVWRTVANFGSPPAIGQDYVMAGTPYPGTTEPVTLTSLVPAAQILDRYYRLRVSAN